MLPSWILSRKKLLFLALCDFFIILILYIFTFLNEGLFSFNLIVNLLFIISTWLMINYILGRYYPKKYFNFKETFQSLIKDFSLIIITFFLYLSFQKLILLDFGEYFLNNYLFSFYLKIGLISIAFQRIFNFLLFRRKKDFFKWIFIGTKSSYEQLIFETSRGYKKFNIDFFNINSKENFQIDPSYLGYILENNNNCSEFIKNQILNLKNMNYMKVYKVIDWCEYFLQSCPSKFITNEDIFIGKFSNPSTSIHFRIKRLGDLIFSSILLIFSIPLFLVSFLAIYLEDGYSFFYSQIRVGKNSKNFKISKIRTMKINAENNGVQWAKKNDTRITKVGKILRKTRIDELPQLVAVLKGEMSLIGPRPERPEFEEKLKQNISHYSLRHSIRPGISGWAQVNFPYGASVEDAEIKLGYDLYYQKNYSLMLDLLIFFKTIKLVLNAQGSTPKL